METACGLQVHRILTRIIAVLDVVLATLGFFFNPFNDEAYDVPFLYWKVTITCFIFEIWMIVSIHLFVAAQKVESQGHPGKSVKYCRYWLIIATSAFIVFEGIIVFPPGADENPLSKYYLPVGIFIYRFFATLIVLRYKSKLSEYAKTVSSQLQDSLNKYPDIINSATITTRCKCNCDLSRSEISSTSSYDSAELESAAVGVSSLDLLQLHPYLDLSFPPASENAHFSLDPRSGQLAKGAHV